MREPMHALTIKQPWAGCIAHLDKRVENRRWPCPHRFIGQRIAIHSAAAVDKTPISVPDGDDWASLFADRAEWDAWRCWHLGTARHRDVEHWPPKLVLGAVVATAVITACHIDGNPVCQGDPRTAGWLCSIWARLGQYHWQLGDVQLLAEPIPCTGQQRLWRLPEDVEHATRAQLAEASHG
jgi:hypothetical protein